MSGVRVLCEHSVQRQLYVHAPSPAIPDNVRCAWTVAALSYRAASAHVACVLLHTQIVLLGCRRHIAVIVEQVEEAVI
jgi:hypothetical protein